MVKCPICKSINPERELIYHADKTYYCSWCNKIFNKKGEDITKKR